MKKHAVTQVKRSYSYIKSFWITSEGQVPLKIRIHYWTIYLNYVESTYIYCFENQNFIFYKFVFVLDFIKEVICGNFSGK